MFLNFYLTFGFTYFYTYHFRKIYVCISKKKNWNNVVQIISVYISSFTSAFIFFKSPIRFCKCSMNHLLSSMLSQMYTKHTFVTSKKVFVYHFIHSHSSWVDKVAKIAKKLTTHHHLVNLRGYGFFTIINSAFPFQ